MELSHEAFLGLKRHFLGALTEPPRLWLAPSLGPRLLFTAQGGLRGGGRNCVVDFGTVESPGKEMRTLRVCNLGHETVTATLQDLPPWLGGRWLQPGNEEVVYLTPGERGVELELTAEHDCLADTAFQGSIHLLVQDLSGNQFSEEIQVQMATHRTSPLGQYDFQCFQEPRPFDFGILDPMSSDPESLTSYKISVQNLTSVPLMVSFADLPVWLVFEVDGYQRRGPAIGRFFERAAPFQVEIRPIHAPQFLGTQNGRLCLWTNDPRPSFQTMELQLSARIEAARAYLRALPPEPVHTSSTEPCWLEIVVENWGQSSARVSLRAPDSAIELAERPEVPGAMDSQPGRATLRIQISPARLSPGSHAFSLALLVEDGVPPEITVPVRINVKEPPEGEAALKPLSPRPAHLPHSVAVAALFVLLLLLALVVLAVEGRF